MRAPKWPRKALLFDPDPDLKPGASWQFGRPSGLGKHWFQTLNLIEYWRMLAIWAPKWAWPWEDKAHVGAPQLQAPPPLPPGRAAKACGCLGLVGEAACTHAWPKP